MKAKTIFRAYLWGEALFTAYLLFKPKEPVASQSTVDQLKTELEKLKDKIENGTQDP